MPASSPRVFVTAVALLATCLVAPAQIAPWSSVASTASQNVQAEQALVVVTQGNTVRAFSALTKTWTSITTSFAPPANTLLNEHLIVRDGPMFHGYSPYTGAFQSLFVASPSPTIVASGSPQTWHSLVIDGNQLHAFYALTGQWVTYVFTAPPVVSPGMNGRFCFLVSDGTTVYGASSFYGSLVPVPAAGAVASGAWGNVGIATSPGLVHGFSASRNTWAPMATPGTPVITAGNAQPAFVAIRDGTSTWLFSGHTGGFSNLPVAPTVPLSLERCVGVAVDGSAVYAYSALLGRVESFFVAAPPTITVQQMYALIDDGVTFNAFSAPKGAFAPPMTSVGMALQTRAQIAAIVPSGSTVPIAVYSAYRNEWVAGPPIGSGTAYLTAVSVVVEETGGGLWGWSHRGTMWLNQPAPVMEIVAAGTSQPALAETFFSRAGNTIYTFNPRTSAWRTAATSAPATLIRAHHAVVIAQDGANAYAFSIWDDQWTSVALPAPYASGGGQVETAWVTEGSRVYAYGGVGQTSMITEFPDFYRAATLGSRFRLQVTGEPGAAMLLGVSLGGTSVPVPPYGTLLLDPASMIILAGSTLPQSGIFTLTLQVPLDPSLTGLEPHFQAGIAGGAGLYLTNSVFPTIY